MTALIIRVGREGVEKVSADTHTISDLNEASELVRASSTATRLLHESVQQFFSGEKQAALEDEPEVLLPSYNDGDPDFPRKIKIRSADGPRDPFNEPPQWFVSDLKKAFPDAWIWESAEDLPGGEGEAAVMFFANGGAPRGWLDHWGWVEETLVSEPYVINMAQIAELLPFFQKLGWTFRIAGVSAHYPSDTLRIEITSVTQKAQKAQKAAAQGQQHA